MTPLREGKRANVPGGSTRASRVRQTRMTADDSTHRRRAKSLHERQIALHGAPSSASHSDRPMRQNRRLSCKSTVLDRIAARID